MTFVPDPVDAAHGGEIPGAVVSPIVMVEPDERERVAGVWRVELSGPRPYCGLIRLDRFQRLETGRYDGVSTVPC